MTGVGERALYLGVLVVLTVGTLAGVALPLGPDAPPPPAPDASDEGVQTTTEGVRYTVHPSELRQGCPGGRDCIPSIDDPQFQSAEDATWLAGDDLVIGVESDGAAKAYPLRILNVHEIVNDDLAGRPIAVTYCPLCRSGLVFSRTVDGRPLEFGVSGKLLDANLVMYDRRTETYWSQIEGQAIVGPLVPTELTIVPSSLTTWEQWRSEHPGTRVLSRDTGVFPADRYGSNPYAGYQEREGVGFGVDRVDDRLPAKTVVYGVTVGGTSRAYPEDVVRDRRVINDEVEEIPVLVVEDPDEGSVKLFDRRIANRTFVFSIEDGDLVDRNGTRWSYDGEALEGPYEGERLERLPSHGFFWFAWSSFHPETDLYGNATDGN